MTAPPSPTDASSLAGLTVCIVVCHYHPEATGSAPYNTALADALARAGAEVTVVAGVPHYPQWEIQDPIYRRGLRWRETHESVRLIRVRHAVPSVPDMAGRARMELSFAGLAAPQVLATKADVVITVTPLMGALLAARLGRRGRPLGVIVHDLTGNAAQQSGAAGGGAARKIARAEYSLIRGADLIGVITPRFRDVLTAQGLRPDTIVDLPIFTHITGSEMPPSDARRALAWEDPDHLFVVHTGNMGMKQGLETVIEAGRFAADEQLPVTFVLVGDGNQRASLESAGRSIPNVRFVAPVDDDQYPLVLAAADVLLLNERPGVMEMSLPSKLTSYVAARRPIIAAVEAGSIAHSVLGEFDAAKFVRSGDGAALATAAMGLRDAPEQVDELVTAARELGRSRYNQQSGQSAFVEFARTLAERAR